MHTVRSADGTEIAYERHGDGPPLVLLHGGSSPEYWRPLVPHFAEDDTVVVPHRRGVGESGDSDAYDLERGVEDVRAVLEAVDGEPVLFGHSFGGLLALEAARTVPLRKLLVYEPAVLVGDYREHADLAARMQARLDDGDRHEAMKFYVREVIHGGSVDDLDAWLAEWPPWPEIVGLTENIVRINHAIEAYELPDSFEFTTPTLVLTGTEGPPHLRDSARAVDDAIPDSRLLEFEGIGHAGPAEAPDRVLPEVRGFLETELKADGGPCYF